MSTPPDTFADAVFAQARRCLEDDERVLKALAYYESDALAGRLSASELRGFLHGLFTVGLLDVLDYDEMVSALGREARRVGRASEWT